MKISDAGLGIFISVPIAVPLLFLILLFTGQIQSIFHFSWQGVIWLSSAGILHFIVGRSLMYKCVQLVGANIAGILRRIDILVSVFIGIILLHEQLSWDLAIGIIFIIFGVTMTGLNSQMFRDPYGQFSRIPGKAFVLGFGCGLAWGVSPILIKLGIKETGSPVAGAFISFLAATIVLSFLFAKKRKRISEKFSTGAAASLFFIAGLFAFFANLARYTALSMAPASVVVPLVSITPVFLLFFSFIFNRNIEIINRSVIIGTIAIVIGTILVV